MEFVLFNGENPLFDRKPTFIIGNSIVKTIGDLENPPLGFPYYKSGLRVQISGLRECISGFHPRVLRTSHTIMTKKTKAQSTPLAKAARQSLEEISSSEDEDKPTQHGAPGTGATVSPSSSSSSSSSASATVTAAASTSNPDRSRRAATQPKAAPKKKGKAAATSEDSSTIALWLGKTQVCVASLLKIEPPQALPHPVLSRHRRRRLRRKLN